MADKAKPIPDGFHTVTPYVEGMSFQAAYAAPILMMSQNRQAEKDHLQVKNDYEVNLKAELEIMQPHEKFNELRDSSWVDLVRMQQQQIEMLDRLLMEDRARRP